MWETVCDSSVNLRWCLFFLFFCASVSTHPRWDSPIISQIYCNALVEQPSCFTLSSGVNVSGCHLFAFYDGCKLDYSLINFVLLIPFHVYCWPRTDALFFLCTFLEDHPSILTIDPFSSNSPQSDCNCRNHYYGCSYTGAKIRKTQIYSRI